MKVVKRDGRTEPVSFDKIKARIEAFAIEHVDAALITQKVVQGLYDGIRTAELDTYAAETAAYMNTPYYDRLAAALAISNLHKQTDSSYVNVCTRLYKHAALISEDVYKVVCANGDRVQRVLHYQRDFQYTYFGFKTLCNKYLIRVDDNIVERPQHMLMRVALGMYCTQTDGLEQALSCYEDMSRLLYTHASPTLFNAGTPRPQCSSCFLLTMTDDSIDGIFETLTRCARISKYAGGVGVNVSTIRAKGAYIAGTNGESNGLVPMLRVYNNTARYVDQGGGKRKGAFAVYIEPWHADLMDVLQLKKNTGVEELRARDLFYALWNCDLFMRRVEEDGMWSLMCPHECPGLVDVHGEAFDALYTRYESEKRYKRQLRARDVWYAILDAQIETGVPYMLYKDAANAKSNQKHLGTIRGSNLCCEVMEYTAPDEVAVCNLASMSLPAFVRDGHFDFNAFDVTVRRVVRNLNRIIDINFYPVVQARTSNMRHRPIGLGVQGLQQVFFKLRMPFDSAQAAELNKRIFARMYYAACDESMALAQRDGPYESFHGSPTSEGLLQPDLWPGVTPDPTLDWDALRAKVRKHGLRNSLLVAPMPTASTSQILGNTECFEPQGSNIYARHTLAGDFTVVNEYLVHDLRERGLWNAEMQQLIIAEKGSIQAITSIPEDLRALYKTVYEIKQRTIIDMAADRAPYVDQSQSMNLHVKDVTRDKMTSLHFHAWRRGLKTGMYYLRTEGARDAVAFTVDPDIKLKASFGGDMQYKKRDDACTDSCGA